MQEEGDMDWKVGGDEEERREAGGGIGEKRIDQRAVQWRLAGGECWRASRLRQCCRMRGELQAPAAGRVTIHTTSLSSTTTPTSMRTHRHEHNSSTASRRP